MAKQTINIGASPNDGTGTPLRTSFDYCNQNFTELYTATGPSGNNIVVPGNATITGDLTVDTSTLKVDSTNNRVGIGTATPTAAFDILGAFGTSTAAAVIRNNSAANNSNISQVQFFTVNSFNGIEQVASIHGTNPNAGANNGGALVFNTSLNGTSTTPAERYRIGNDGTATWSVAGSTAMTLNSTGLGVGVTPSAWGSGYKVIQGQIGGFALSNDNSSNNQFRLSSNAYFDTTDSRWEYYGSSTATAYEQRAGEHRFFNAISGSANTAIAFTQAMTLDAVGNLHVGTTAYLNTGVNFVNSLKGFNIVPDDTANAANRNWNLAVNGGAAGNLDFVISSANNTFPNFAYRMQLTSAGALNNTTGTYGTISDLRLKENISDARNYLADLLKLRVVKYSLKEESSAVATKLGFIAQEVELVFPNLVDQSDKEYDGAEGIRSVKTSILIPMLLKAIQELTARVQTLEAR
jgi:hypothetical protein